MKANPLARALMQILVLVAGASILNGQVVWIKDARNPLLPGGTEAEWDANVFMPMVLYNTDSSRYEMWYGGADLSFSLPYQIGFAVSKDGLGWTKYGPPVMTPEANTWEERRFQVPVVVRENGKYKMWYGGVRGFKGGLGYATSPDGIHWTKYPGNPVLGPGTAAWEADGPLFCDVLPVPGGGYKMWYSGVEAYPSATARIGIATSVDGISWQRDTVSNPVVNIGATGQWDDSYVMEAHVFRIDSTYYLWYTGAGVQASVRRIGLATSTNGTTWMKHATNPVLVPSGGGWDNRWLEAGSLMLRGDTLILWYAGSSTLRRWAIGRATSAIVTGIAEGKPEVPQTFGLAQNYPNPFNPSTTIRYGLPNRSHVTLTVFNTLGQQVAQLVNGDMEAGYYELPFYASGLSSGVYFYRMTAGTYSRTLKSILMK